MQAFRHGSRFARAASMSIKAEAAEGGPAAAARREGLTARKAAEVVGVPKSTLFGWDKLRRENRLEPRSRRPRRVRRADWPESLVRTAEEIRQDQPIWGKAKIAAAIRWEWSGRKTPARVPSGGSSSSSCARATSFPFRRCAERPRAPPAAGGHGDAASPQGSGRKGPATSSRSTA